MAAIELNPEAVNKLLADSIMESSLGTYLRGIAEKQFQELRSSYKNPIEDALRQEVFKVVRELVQTEFREKIEATVREKLTDDILSGCAIAAWNTFYAEVEKHRYDR